MRFTSRNVLGRKTDVKDCEWIAQLLQRGLLRSSFVPDRGIRELRGLNRHRIALIGERNRVANRVQKVLEQANIKLAAAVRRGKKRALVAVAHTILVIAWHVLKSGSTYQELGDDYFEKGQAAALPRP
jgi:hypothetical protein